MPRKRSEPLITLGWSIISWVEHFLVHGPGDVEGQPIVLDDEFSAFILKGYRLTPSGARVVRRAFLSRAKGRSKSGLAAMLACVEALGPARFDHFAESGEVSSWGYVYDEGEPVGRPVQHPEVLCVATEENQAGNTYDGIYYMLGPETCSDALLAEFGPIDIGLARINLPGGGFIEPVTSSDSSKDGGKSTFIVADETHLWVLPRLRRLHGIMTRNLLKRKIASGWMLETSTMYAPGEDSVAEGTHKYAQSVREGRLADQSLLFDHVQAPTDLNLALKRDRMRGLRLAYGPAADWMNLEAICNSWNDPQVKEADFRRYWLNQPVSTSGSWLPFGAWQAITDATRTIADGSDVVLALDGSFNGDTTGIIVVSIEDKPHIDVVEAWERPPDAPQDWRVPIADVEASIKRACLRWRVREVTADPFRWARSLQELDAEGVPVSEFEQTSKRMTPATKNFYNAVVDQDITQSGHLMLERHIGNAVLHEDSRGTRITKETAHSTRRIDLAVCSIMGLERARFSVPEVVPEFYSWADL